MRACNTKFSKHIIMRLTSHSGAIPSIHSVVKNDKSESQFAFMLKVQAEHPSSAWTALHFLPVEPSVLVSSQTMCASVQRARIRWVKPLRKGAFWLLQSQPPSLGTEQSCRKLHLIYIFFFPHPTHLRCAVPEKQREGSGPKKKDCFSMPRCHGLLLSRKCSDEGEEKPIMSTELLSKPPVLF